ncbi:hypothetical protein KACHI17_07780 [Sediminibacterium sp. KACHI17]|uniref:Uncharacterized protein n=1 Tax=Sediminibacterium sp. KACHI17 TaxID=1751071 RepID=A0AAT9GHB6_9BACT
MRSFDPVVLAAVVLAVELSLEVSLLNDLQLVKLNKLIIPIIQTDLFIIPAIYPAAVFMPSDVEKISDGQ